MGGVCSRQDRPSLRAPRLALVAVGVAMLAVAGCPRVRQPAPTDRGAGELIVPLQIEEAGGGSVLALVPVYIGSEGPFAFALDTGASISVVDQQIAERLRLQSLGRARPVAGVFSADEVEQVRVEQWRVGDVELPASTIMMLDLPDPPEGQRGLEGLLGSDVLSRYGAVTIDYDQGRMTLRSHPERRR